MSPALESPKAGPSVGDVVAGKYKLQRRLGEGGMGQVFLAQHEITERPVAVKIVATADPVTRKRLLGEARAMGRLSHPNVVGVLDMGEWQGSVFLVMEYQHGRTLSRLMKGEPFSPAEALRLLMPACSGVAAAHQAGILHRDLKPENLFVLTDRDGEPITTKVLDFGVAKALDEAEGSVTDTGVIVGTPRYMAPEQIEKDGVLDERTDIYALGLILYELLVGRLPYASGSLRSVMLEILKGDFAAPHHLEPSVPAELSKIVLGALSLDPQDRPPTVEAFATAIEPFGDDRFEAPLAHHTFSDAPDSVFPESIRSRHAGSDQTTDQPGHTDRQIEETRDAREDTAPDSRVGAITDTLPSTDRPGAAGAAPAVASKETESEHEKTPGRTRPRTLWAALGALGFGAALAWTLLSGHDVPTEADDGTSTPGSSTHASAEVPPPKKASSAVPPAASPVPSSEEAAEAPSQPAATPSSSAPAPATATASKPPVRIKPSRKPEPVARPTALPPPARAPAPPRPKTDNRDPWAEAP